MKFRSGVLYGDEVTSLLNDANINNYALPAVNVISSSSINAVLESASKVNSPVIIQFGHRACMFYAGDYLPNLNQQAAIFGGVAAAMHVHTMARIYNVPVILHTDHCNKSLLPWIDGLLREGESFYEKNGCPLYSSHMLDLSLEPIKENLSISKLYLEKMSKLDMSLEIELGVTGGVEEDMDNSAIDNSKFYTQPSEVAEAYSELNSINERFMIAASFGNVHGVYKPGNVKLTPKILRDSQKYIKSKFNTSDNPVNFVFHGGSGSSRKEIRESIEYGVVKMNINTDLQWAYWNGVKSYEQNYRNYLQSQIGNPESPDAPNKTYYDPRKWLRTAEQFMVDRLEIAFKDLNCIDRNT